MVSSEEQYDYASTIFSLDGRLFQVEYAREAIDKGTPTIGIKYLDGVVLLVYKDPLPTSWNSTRLIKSSRLTSTSDAPPSDMVADTRHLIEIAREEAQINKILYGERIPVRTLVQHICDYQQVFTYFDGVRPFGVALLIAGVDTAPEADSTSPIPPAHL